MATTTLIPTLLPKSLANKEIDLDSDVLKVMLCTSAYTPNKDTHQYKSSVTGEVASNGTTNYVAGGVALSSVTVATNTTTDQLTLDAADVAFPSGTLTARYAVFYDSSPASDATRPILIVWDFGADVSVTADVLRLIIDAAGLLVIQA